MYLIRLSTSKNMGRGHISRCIKLRNKINKEVIWFIDKNTKNDLVKIVKDRIIEENNPQSISKTTKFALKYNVKAIIIDMQNTENFIQNEIFNKKPIIVIVDKYLIVKNALSICMHPLHIEEKNFISGLKYLPITKKKQNKFNIKNILISFGNVDSNSITEKVIKAIIEIMQENVIKKNEYKIYIILGKYKKNAHLITKMVSKQSNFIIFKNPIDMSLFYKKCEFAVGSPGFSQIERLEYKIPTILIAQNTTQKKLLQHWQKSGCALVVKPNYRDLKNKIILMFQSEEIKNNIRKSITKNIDNKGITRMVKKIESFINNFKNN